MIDKIKSLIADLNPDDDMLLISLLNQKLEYGKEKGIDLSRFKNLNKIAINASYRSFQRIASDFLSETLFKNESEKIEKAENLVSRIGECGSCKYSIEQPSKYGGTYLGQNENNPICKSCFNRCCRLEDYVRELENDLWEKKKPTMQDENFKSMLYDFATLRLMMNNIIEKNRTIKKQNYATR